MLNRLSSTTYQANFPNGKARVSVHTQPELLLTRWDDECRLRVRLREPVSGLVQEIMAGEAQFIQDIATPEQMAILNQIPEKIKLQSQDKIIEFYQLAPTEQYEDGGLEFEIILNERPASNIFEWEIETEGLSFHYQPELTQEDRDSGALRKENTIGSYAVYHTSRCNNEYKTGKAFHIYRPRIVDANGDGVWGELDIDEDAGILSITVAEEWLANAVYPVYIDPTFGYTSKGTVGGNLSPEDIRGTRFTAHSGAVKSITYYVKDFMGLTEDVQYAIYRVISEDSGELLGKTASAVVPLDFLGWMELDLIGEVQIESGDYWLCIRSNGYLPLCETRTGRTSGVLFDAGSDFPESLVFEGIFSNEPWDTLSIYATYREEVDNYTATANGQITDTGGTNCNKRGFVYGAVSLNDPGNIAPEDTSYDNYIEETGSFSAGPFSLDVTDLNPDTTYYIRAYAYNEVGYSYGTEEQFTTTVEQLPEDKDGTVSISSGGLAVGVGKKQIRASIVFTAGGSILTQGVALEVAGGSVSVFGDGLVIGGGNKQTLSTTLVSASGNIIVQGVLAESNQGSIFLSTGGAVYAFGTKRVRAPPVETVGHGSILTIASKGAKSFDLVSIASGGSILVVGKSSVPIKKVVLTAQQVGHIIRLTWGGE